MDYRKPCEVKGQAMCGFGAFIFPGLGHLLAGKPFQAMFWFVLIVVGYLCFVVPGVLLHLVSIIDAVRAERRNTVKAISEGVRRGSR
jgi:hypothetical protein